MIFLNYEADFLPAKEDGIFKSIFTRNEKESRIILMDLISSVIGKRVVEVVIRANEPAKDSTNEKHERLDIYCTVDDGEIINLEMQGTRIAEISSTHTNLINKYLYYGCDLVVGQQIKGKSYDELKKTYQITFCAYTIFKEKADFITRFQMKDEDGEPLTDNFNIIFIELGKLKEITKKAVKDMTSFEKWCLFLGYSHDRSKRNLLNEIIESKEEIGMAVAILDSISKNPDERAKYISRKKFETDMQSNLIVSKRQGEIIGEKRGEIKGGIKRENEIACNLLDMGFDIEDIVKATGLSAKKIEQLREGC